MQEDLPETDFKCPNDGMLWYKEVLQRVPVKWADMLNSKNFLASNQPKLLKEGLNSLNSTCFVILPKGPPFTMQQLSTNTLTFQTKCFWMVEFLTWRWGFAPSGLLEIASFRPLAEGKPTDKKPTEIAVKRWVVPLWLQQRNETLKIEMKSSKRNPEAVIGSFDQRVKVVVCRV